MESSEDDAGAATNASRRSSARETDIEEKKDIDASAETQKEQPHAGRSCGTPAMSEDNFDGDSVPSPSTQDVNTSTEAILDMIDDFIEGPGASRRTPLRLEDDNPDPPDPGQCATDKLMTVNQCDNLSELKNKPAESIPAENHPESVNLPTPSTIKCEMSEIAYPHQSDTHTQIQSESNETGIILSCTPFEESSCSSLVVNEHNIPIASSSVQQEERISISLEDQNTNAESKEVVQVPTVLEEHASSSKVLLQAPEKSVSLKSDEQQDISSVQNQTFVSPNVTSVSPALIVESEPPASSFVLEVQSKPSSSVNRDCSDSEMPERTVKYVTSSESNETLTVENVESTSSDNIVSAPMTRSPLKRRLVRPARPDSTVSSTVDVQSNTTQIPESTSRQNITKEVSSSSDAVISAPDMKSGSSMVGTISEVNVCKAETSSLVSSPKKIKLIRNKLTAPVSNTVQVEQVSQPQQCQSTTLLPETSGANLIQTTEPTSQTTQHESGISLNSISTLDTDTISEENTGNVLVSNITCDSKTSFENQQDKDTKPFEFLSKASTSKNTDVESEKVTDSVAEIEHMKVPPIKLNLSNPCVVMDNSEKHLERSKNIESTSQECFESVKQVPKLTIKLCSSSKQNEEMKSPIPKLTIKPLKPPVDESAATTNDLFPNVTKLNIKAIPKPAEKINDFHRKSSSSDISESSECSENDETSMSDQASASDQGLSDVIPKVTIKLGKPGTHSEGKFYTEKNVTKLNSEEDDERQFEKIPKLTIKPVLKTDSQQISPKLIIKSLKPASDSNQKELTVELCDIPKLKITQESLSPKDSSHVPKITIKPVTKTDPGPISKGVKKMTSKCEELDQIPIVTKLNIKPIPKPAESSETSSNSIEDIVPVVSKLNIKPIVKPSKDIEIDSSIEDIPKVTKLNIKPLKNPEEIFSEAKDCDEWNSGNDEKNIPVVTKINIKPIIKPADEEIIKDSENQSSETGNSSDENTDQIPVVTKLNIKPVLRPNDIDEVISLKSNILNEDKIPVVTKLNIKPLLKPDDSGSPLSPKRDRNSDYRNTDNVPVLTKINIKPILKPENIELKSKESDDSKMPPLVMKINIKSMADSSTSDTKSEPKINCTEEHKAWNNVNEVSLTPPVNIKSIDKTVDIKVNEDHIESNCQTKDVVSPCEKNYATSLNVDYKHNCLPDQVIKNDKETVETKKHNELINCLMSSSSSVTSDLSNVEENKPLSNEHCTLSGEKSNESSTDYNKTNVIQQFSQASQKSSTQTCTLLKKLLEETTVTKMEGKLFNCTASSENMLETHEDKSESVNPAKVCPLNNESNEQTNQDKFQGESHDISSKSYDLTTSTCELVTKPLEINTTSEKVTSSGQDSPRIILKINKTEHGASSEIITEDLKSNDSIQSTPPPDSKVVINHQKALGNSRKKLVPGELVNSLIGKRLRSSRVVQGMEKSPSVKRYVAKRNTAVEDTPEQNKEPDMSILESKRVKLGKLLLNKSLTITPIEKETNVSPPKSSIVDLNLDIKQNEKSINNTLVNNENCSNKNGNSKLHKILSNLQAKQMQALPQMQVLPRNDSNCTERNIRKLLPELESTNTSTGSSDVIEIPLENSHREVQEMLINESSVSRDFVISNDETARDPLEVDTSKLNVTISNITPEPAPMTPPPKKRGRPRKLPASEGAKPVSLPLTALEERPQRSLRLSRDRPVIIAKPRGRGRGRGAKRAGELPAAPEPLHQVAAQFFSEQPKPEEDIDPTSSRIKLPRMTEALDNMPSTPLSSRRRNSSLTSEGSEMKVALDSVPADELMKSPDEKKGTRGGRGRGKTPGRTPRNRGRGRGGGRGAVYMKETMGIYGRVCGPATTTVQLFEEETCMMDDNATPAKPSHLLDEDSQSSIKSSTNESSKMRKSKFADLFDSNKVWTAADVKEYKWPPPENESTEHQVMMIQEQVAMFLGVRSFKRRYPELQRRAVVGAERDYLRAQGLATEALCDLGITAVDASEVLDIMLSDYPHKYEEYRSHQRARQLAAVSEPKPVDVEVKVETRIEMKVESKPEPPKVDPEKLRLELAAAAIASAAEWNARANASRAAACVDLQSLALHRRRPPRPPPPPPRVRPPHGFYPLALLPGQYQHCYRLYAPQQLRYFPLNTALAAPPAPVSPVESSDSEDEWGSATSSSEDSDRERSSGAKRRKLMKVREVSTKEEEESTSAEVETCRVCGLREEANRKYSHERFLSCSNCLSKLHPSCLELGPDTIRKCRDYAWQCAECKSCCGCQQPADDDKMLFCDLCDRGFHIYCVGLNKVPSGRWHCVECAVCKSCGARSPAGVAAAAAASAAASASGDGEPEWHHQSKRGPGGHKVYSHSLCTPCARAYRIGRYCPLCERSFIGPKGTMQLVICKLCDRQLHQECVKQSVSNLNVLDYTCGECKRGGITSRAAAARLAPRTIATLFMAKRRFNKYAHRQYMQSRLQSKASDGDAEEPPSSPRDPRDPLDPLATPEETSDADKTLQLDEDC